MSPMRRLLIFLVAGLLADFTARGQDAEFPLREPSATAFAGEEAEEPDEIETDRDSFTPATTTAAAVLSPLRRAQAARYLGPP